MANRRRYCSSTWRDDVARGAAYPPGMVPCRVCRYEVPPIYVGGGGRCFDCSLARWLQPRREVPARRRELQPLPLLAWPGALSLLTRRQRELHGLVLAGLSVAAIAGRWRRRERDVWAMLRRLRTRLENTPQRARVRGRLENAQGRSPAAGPATVGGAAGMRQPQDVGFVPAARAVARGTPQKANADGA